MTKLMIVESPEKAQTIQKYLGDGWVVRASVGHINDMSKDGLGFDKETLDIDYQLSDKGKKIVSELKQIIKRCDKIYLATDLDREGEAISYALKKELNINNYERCVFDRVTKDAVLHAIQNTRQIDMNMVHAQESRRILDRAVGWQSTEALTNYVGKLMPVGRVQSQIVKIIVNREREIEAFSETKHFNIKAFFDQKSWNAMLKLKESGLGQTIGDKNKTLYWLDDELSKHVTANAKQFEVLSTEMTKAASYAPPAFDTISMQQAAFNKLGFNGKKCDSVAQSLYQNGHITYIRTDSTNISDESYERLKAYADANKIRLDGKKREGKKAALAQEAHECIQPTDYNYRGEGLSGDEKKLYDLIWNRTMASQAAPTISDVTTVELKTVVDDKDYFFKAVGSVVIDKGWREIYADMGDDNDSEAEAEAKNKVPANLKDGDIITANEVVRMDQKTTPPSYYTEASIKDYLKKAGIGRPSTYSNLIEKVGENGHKYIYTDNKGKGKKGYLRPNSTAFELVDSTNDVLSIMNSDFTAQMEQSLDDIVEGKVKYDAFVKGFLKTLDSENKALNDKEPITPRVHCEKCESTMLKNRRKDGKGEYWRCTNKDCGHVAADNNGKPLTEADREARRKQKEEQIKAFTNEDGTPKFPCPECQSVLIRLKSKKKEGVYFWACSKQHGDCNFLDFEHSETQTPNFAYLNELKKEFSNPNGTAKYPCPECGNFLVKKTSKKGNPYWGCISLKTKCEYMTGHNDQEDRPLTKEEAEARKKDSAYQPDWLKQEIEASKDKDGNYKWFCVACKSPLHQKLSKNGKIYYKCQNEVCSKMFYDKDGEPDFSEGDGKKGKGSGMTPKPKPKGR